MHFGAMSGQLRPVLPTLGEMHVVVPAYLGTIGRARTYSMVQTLRIIAGTGQGGSGSSVRAAGRSGYGRQSALSPANRMLKGP
jgi:hypothetical protein